MTTVSITRKVTPVKARQSLGQAGLGKRGDLAVISAPHQPQYLYLVYTVYTVYHSKFGRRLRNHFSQPCGQEMGLQLPEIPLKDMCLREKRPTMNSNCTVFDYFLFL